MDYEEISKELASGLEMTFGAPNIVELEAGRLLRAECKPDEETDVTVDGDAWGEFAKVTYNRTWGRQNPRPDGFDGRARKVGSERHMWWQPTADLPDDQIDKIEARINELMQWGYKGVTVELCEGHDTYGRAIPVASASLWGIDSFEGEYGYEVVLELVLDVMAEAERDNTQESNGQLVVNPDDLRWFDSGDNANDFEEIAISFARAARGPIDIEEDVEDLLYWATMRLLKGIVFRAEYEAQRGYGMSHEGATFEAASASNVHLALSAAADNVLTFAESFVDG